VRVAELSLTDRYIAGCLVWIIVLLIVLIWLAITAVCLMKGGSFLGVAIQTDDIMDTVARETELDSAQVGQMDAYLSTADSEQEQRVWMYVGHASCAFTAVFVLLVCAGSARIQLTIELIKVTAKIIQETPGTMLIPILEWVVAGLMLLYFLAGAALIVTTDWDPKADLQQALAETNPDGSSRCPPSLCTPPVRTVTAALSDPLDSKDQQHLMLAYMTFGYYWALFLLDAVKSMVVAAAIGTVFWSKSKAGSRWPTLAGLRYVLRWHLGSACFGAFLLAVIAGLRALLTYVPLL